MSGRARNAVPLQAVPSQAGSMCRRAVVCGSARRTWCSRHPRSCTRECRRPRRARRPPRCWSCGVAGSGLSSAPCEHWLGRGCALRVVAGWSEWVTVLGPAEILLLENGGHKFAATAHAGLFEDRLEVVLDGVLGDTQSAGDLSGRGSLEYKGSDCSFLAGEAVDVHDKRSELFRGCLLDDHRDGVLLVGRHP